MHVYTMRIRRRKEQHSQRNSLGVGFGSPIDSYSHTDTQPFRKDESFLSRIDVGYSRHIC